MQPFYSGYIAILFHLPWADVARVTLFILRLRFRVRTLFFGQKIQGLFKDFQGPISHFSKDSIHCKKEPQHEQFYPEGLSVFASFRRLRIWVG